MRKSKVGFPAERGDKQQTSTDTARAGLDWAGARRAASSGVLLLRDLMLGSLAYQNVGQQPSTRGIERVSDTRIRGQCTRSIHSKGGHWKDERPGAHVPKVAKVPEGEVRYLYRVRTMVEGRLRMVGSEMQPGKWKPRQAGKIDVRESVSGEDQKAPGSRRQEDTPSGHPATPSDTQRYRLLP
ncbi:hypothetical protein BGZ61DRAFT_487274 [Ilyonectria robusta]|uniref:uncharacterized protein n=1 Tax=Ilyonectria robusta TaxID=1079257 RepID=UPI001E8D01F1|nr:uncharacterized protein BGZ61DRAFT_487274 [Ilyonectria robusta]KAH8653304.1 hypothetical protein BGZ61DRAFT_487274 [Ilyonectria robusta]